MLLCGQLQLKKSLSSGIMKKEKNNKQLSCALNETQAKLALLSQITEGFRLEETFQII